MEYKKLLFNKNKVYETKFFLYQYNDNNLRIVKQKYARNKGFEDIKVNGDKVDKDEVERISISRTRRNIRELSLCNNFEYFATFTLDPNKCDRYSLTECQNLLRKKLKALKRRNNNFAYLFITEKHKDGAFHFHGLIKGVYDFYENEFGYLSHELFDTMGFNSFSKIRDYNKCCNYITKYITKDCVKNDSGTVYISSRGLKKASRYQIEPLDIDYQFENDFVAIKDYNIEKTDTSSLLSLLTITHKEINGNILA